MYGLPNSVEESKKKKKKLIAKGLIKVLKWNPHRTSFEKVL